MKKLNITFCSTPDFSSNAKALYYYMVKRYKKEMNFVWVVKNEIVHKQLLKKNVKSYLLGTPDYYDYVKTTDVFFTTHGNITGDKPENSLYIELWHGVSSKPVGFLMKNLKPDDENWYNHLKRKIDYIIVPSSFWIPIFSSRFNIKPNRILDLGYPKLNYLTQTNGKNNLKKVLNTEISKYDKIIFYSPTFVKGCGLKTTFNVNKENLINLEKYEEKKLDKFLIKNNYLLCIKHHPEDEIKYDSFESENIKIIKSETLLEMGITIDEILNVADLLLTDYSSLGIEFLFLEKPVVYITTDIYNYKLNRGIMFDDFDFWSPGYKVNTIEDLIKKINLSLKKPLIMQKKINAKKQLFFGDREDGNCKKICDYFFKDKNNINEDIIYYIDKEEELEKIIDITNVELNSLLEKNQQLEKELHNIKNSKSWILINKIKRIKRKVLNKKL